MAKHHWSRGIALASLVSGTLVIIVTIWTFGSLLNRDECECENSTLNNTSPNDNPDKLLNSENPEDAGNKEGNSTIWGDFEKMPKSFRSIIFSCDWIAVGGAILQIVISCLILCSSVQNIQNRLKYFAGLHFLALLILGVTLFFPLAYDREEDQFHSMTSFSIGLKKEFQKLGDVTLWNFMMKDLHLYYLVLLVDCVGVVVYIVIASCLLRQYTMEDHKVELFYDRYDRR